MGGKANSYLKVQCGRFVRGDDEATEIKAFSAHFTYSCLIDNCEKSKSDRGILSLNINFNYELNSKCKHLASGF